VPSSAIASPSTIEASGTAKAGRPYALILLGLPLGGLWLICCRHLSAEWSYNEQYNYGWFVPFFALYLFWLRWEDRPEPEVPPSPGFGVAGSGQTSEVRRRRGLVAGLIAIPLLLLLLPLRLIEVANPDWRLVSWVHALAAVALTLLLIWYMGGWPWLRHFAFPVVFILVAVPWVSAIEAPIIQGLMPTVATIATETLSLFGIPAEVQGNLIQISGGVVGVNEACSGVRSLQTSIMIGLLFGELKRLHLFPRIMLVVAAVGLAFVANCGRAFFLVWIAATRGVPEVEHWHDTAGYAIVGIVFLGCLAFTALLSRRSSRDQPSEVGGSGPAKRGHSENNPQFEIRNSKFSFLLPPSYFLISTLAFLLCIELGVEAWYRAHERNLRPSAQWGVHWPESAPQFRELKIDERTRSILHNDEGRGAMWHNANDSLSTTALGETTSLLYFFRWQPGHNSALLANAHRPDVCLPASGWRQTGDFGVRDYQVSSNFAVPFRHFEFRSEGAGRTRIAHAFYCVWEDRIPQTQSADASARGLFGDPSAWTRSERMQAVLQGRRHLGQQVMEYLVIEAGEIGAPEAEEAFAAKVRELVTPTGTKT
jgi:exosortase